MGGSLCSTCIMNVLGYEEMNMSVSSAMMKMYSISVVGLDMSGRPSVPKRINVYFRKQQNHRNILN